MEFLVRELCLLYLMTCQAKDVSQGDSSPMKREEGGWGRRGRTLFFSSFWGTKFRSFSVENPELEQIRISLCVVLLSAARNSDFSVLCPPV